MFDNPHIQSTAKIWPNSPQLKQYISIPLALTLKPFNHQPPTADIPTHLIHQYRCQSCKAFINQLCFIRGDHQYDCSICGCTNYITQPIDISMPALNHLSYHLPAPQQQRVIPTPLRLFTFILDLSNYGQQSRQYLLYSLHIIKQFVKTAHSNALKMNVMIIGFDCGLVRYVVNPKRGGQVESIVSNDGEDDEEYLPSGEEMMGEVMEHMENIQMVLDSIEDIVVRDRLRPGLSKALLPAIKLALKTAQTHSGKIFLISGLRSQPIQFFTSLKPYLFDQTQKHSFMLNKKHCIPSDIDKLISTTQMSLSTFFINNQYTNNMPFHCMTKWLNGELRHYFSNQLRMFFQDFREYVEQMLSQHTVFEGLMRVRYSTGLKMVGLFGNYRPTKVTDQVQLLTCPYTRQMLFQFMIEGRISSDFVVIQFSTLCTDLKGDRYFLIETHCNKLSCHLQNILSSIDYPTVNIAYIRGIVHNLDINIKTKDLHVVIQQRCKKHVKAIRETIRATEVMAVDAIFDDQHFRKAKPYIVTTFLMMKHFLLSLVYQSSINFDLNAELRSKIATIDHFAHIIWPAVYAIDLQGWQIIDMKGSNLSQATVAIFVDRCDLNYVHLKDANLRAQLRTANAKQSLQKLIQSEQSLSSLRNLIQEIKQKKGVNYLDILPLENISELKVLDTQGKFGFDKFINKLIEK